MTRNIKINKGLTINLAGTARQAIEQLSAPETIVIKPTDFNGLVPKLSVSEGDEVKAGTPLFYNKDNESIKFCSPVSGEVVAINRGDKRKILEIKILADKEIKFIEFNKADASALNREQIINSLLSSGIWPFIRQRPYGIVANPVDIPKSIFISAFDSNPLAPDVNYIMQGKDADFQSGLNALQKLTEGKIHLNIKANADCPSVFLNAKGVEINYIAGPHPAGNVGVQIHHLDPINKGEVVWYLQPQDVLIIGRLFNYGKFDTSRVIAVTGSCVNDPKYFTTITGAAVKHVLESAGLKKGKTRIISGNILTGKQIAADGHLGFYDSHITVIPEGDEPEFMGWLKPGFDKFSVSRTFFSWLSPKKIHDLDTNMHGEERAFVMTGQYEKVFPMDIYPVHLIKSILVEDLELMEKLGIYEVVEEDFALCEFVCTSKIESQKIIRQGLDMVRKEFG